MLKQKELLAVYDAQTYYPARKELIKACSDLGHVKGSFHDNGLGWHWWWCSVCGTSFDKENHSKFNDEVEDEN